VGELVIKEFCNQLTHLGEWENMKAANQSIPQNGMKKNNHPVLDDPPQRNTEEWDIYMEERANLRRNDIEH